MKAFLSDLHGTSKKEELLAFFEETVGGLDAWEVLSDFPSLNKKVDNLELIHKYSNDFNLSSDEIKNQLSNIPANQRENWIKKLEFRKEWLDVQKHNTDLISSIKGQNPDLTNKEIADLIKDEIKVPSIPYGFTREQFQRAQTLIAEKLDELGVGKENVIGFATGSRITGTTFNPNKAGFGQKIDIDAFDNRDFDITIIHDPTLSNSLANRIINSYSKEFDHPLGIRMIDSNQIPFIPIYGELNLIF